MSDAQFLKNQIMELIGLIRTIDSTQTSSERFVEDAISELVTLGLMSRNNAPTTALNLLHETQSDINKIHNTLFNIIERLRQWHDAL